MSLKQNNENSYFLFSHVKLINIINFITLNKCICFTVADGQSVGSNCQGTFPIVYSSNWTTVPKWLISELFSNFQGSEIIFCHRGPGKFEIGDNEADISGATGYIKLAN